MRTTTFILAALLALLIIPTVSASYLLRVVADDAVTFLDINPSTLTINGQTKSGTPRAEFQNIPENTVLTLTGSAPGYTTNLDDLFFDGSLQSCVGQQTCSLSRTIGSQTFLTTCGFSAQFQDFECNITNSGLRIVYFFKPQENRVSYVQYLQPNPNPPPNTPPTIVATANPTNGSAPLSVTFNINVQDPSGVQTVTIFFGDGSSQTVPAVSTVVHVYQNPGSFNALIQAFDTAGLQSTFTIPITVNAPGANPGPSIAASVSPTTGNSPLTVTFTANITDANGVQNATWFFGDGTSQVVSANSIITHVYPNAGTFLPFIESFDTLGARSTLSFSIVVNNPAVNTAPVIIASVNPSNGTAPLNSVFTVNVTDNVQVRTVNVFFGDGQSATLLLSGTQNFFNGQVSHLYAAPGIYTAIVQAVDDAGLVTLQSFTITVNAGVNTPPTVNANGNPTQGVSPLAVNFTLNAFDDRGIVSALWLFGDGTTFTVPITGAPSSIQNDILHVYPNAGSFTAQVVVTDTNGAQTTRSVSINVTAPQVDNPPVINAQVVPTFGLPPLTTSFTINVTDNRVVRTVTVFFGDGTSQVLLNNGVAAFFNAQLNHVYANPGTFIALVQAIDDVGQSTVASFNVLVTNPAVNTPPIVSASASPTSGNAPLTVGFLVNATDDVIVSSVVWNFGDGQSQVLLVNGFLPTFGGQINHVYSFGGTFTATVTVTDNQGATTTQSFVITVNVPQFGPPNIVASVNPLTGNVPLTSTFTANVTDDGSVTSVVWFFGDGTSQVVPVNSQITHTYATVGTFFPLILATDNLGLQSFRQFTVTVNNVSGANQPPNITATVVPTVGTAPLTSTFTANVTDDVAVASVIWNFGDGTTQVVGVNSQITHTYPAAGTFIAVITATDNQGAITTRTFTITVNAPGVNQPPNITATVVPTTGNNPLTSTFTANVTDDVAVASVIWNFGDGTTQVVGVNSQITHTYPNPGSFTAVITATDNQGATSTRTFVITVNNAAGNTPPVINAVVNPTSGTVPLTPTFTANITDDVQVSQVTWFFGDGTSQVILVNGTTNFSNSQISHTYASAGTFVPLIVAMDNQGATSTQTFVVTVSPPGAGAGNNTAPVISASVNPTFGNAPLTPVFTANVTDDKRVSSVVWDFGDGTTQVVLAGGTQAFSNTQVAHTYGAAGNFTARVTATDNESASSFQTFLIQVAGAGAGNNTPPVIAASVVPTVGPSPLTVTFTANVTDDVSVSNVVWFFGDGQSQVVGVNSQITHVYPVNGTFVPIIIATDNAGLTSTLSFTVTVQPPGGVVNGTAPIISVIAAPTTGTAPLSTTFNSTIVDDVRVTSATWFFGDGTSAQILVNGSSPVFVNSITHVYQNAGNFTAVLIATDNSGNTVTATVLVNVQGVGAGQGNNVVVDEVIDVFIPHILIDNADGLLPGSLMTSYITFENRGNFQLDGMNVFVAVPELGIRKSLGQVDTPAGKSVTKPIVLELPQGVKPGRYWARITVSNNDQRRVIVREITVVGPPVKKVEVPETIVVTCPGESVWCRFFTA